MKNNSSPIIIVFVAATVSLAWFAWQAWAADADVIRMNEKVRLANEKVRQLEQVAYTSKALESAVRGFLITGDTGFLAYQAQLETKLRTPLQHLLRLSANDPAGQMAVDSLKSAVLQRIVLLSYLADAGRESPAVAGAMVQSRRTPARGDELAVLTERLLQREQAGLDQLLNKEWFQRNSFLYSIIGCIVAGLVLLGGLYRIGINFYKARTAEEALRASEKKYRQLVDDAGTTMFTTNRGGFFTYVNKKAKDLTGYEPEELIGRQYTVLLEPRMQKELREFYENQSFDGTPESTITFPIRMKNGEKKWVEQHVILVERNGYFAGYQCLVKDVHHTKVASERLAEARNEMSILHSRMESILENSSSIIFIKDVHGRYLHVNRRFEEAFGIRLKDVCGRHDKDLPNTWDPVKHAVTDRTTILYEKPQEIEDTIGSGDDTRYFFITKFPLRDASLRVYGLCGIATDITHKVEAENNLKEARKKADNARRAQEIFMANMSHELRTPLNGIIGATNLIQAEATSAQVREYINDIRESANNLLVMVDDLLDFSRIKTGQLHLACEDFAPRHVILRAVNNYRQAAESKGLTLTAELADAVEDHVMGDPTRLYQVLDNLLDNAVKFTETGAVRLTVRVAPAHEKNTRLVFELHDTGIGIPPELINSLGEGFSQLAGGNDRRHGGTGLGLALTRQLILLQGGDMQIMTNPAGGTIVRFAIPFLRSYMGPALPPEMPERPPLAGRHILVAEDNPLNQKVAIRTLEKAGASVTLAVNGVEAIEKLHEQKFDCILMDIQMPEMDGLRATRAIRAAGEGLPIIAMTASALRGDRERCLLTGMNEYISKPFNPEDLYRKIQEVLGDREPPVTGAPPEGLGMQEHPPLIDLSQLRRTVENDHDYLLEALKLFAESAAVQLGHLEQAAGRSDWDETARYAQLLQGSLAIVKIPALADRLRQIGMHARHRRELDTIHADVRLAAQLYAEAQYALKKEMEEMGAG